jgi:FixJ family two-component response regulator
VSLAERGRIDQLLVWLYYGTWDEGPISELRETGQAGAGDARVTSSKPIVIVIDDDPSILRALRRLISGAGFDVRTFDRPSALLHSDLPTTEACLIVDIHLPEMNGVELCSALAASGCRLPVILITAHTDEQTRELASSAHPIALLNKPFGRNLLVNSIETALQIERSS